MGLCSGGPCLGGSLSRGSLSRGVSVSLSGGSLCLCLGGLCPAGLCPGGLPWQTPTPCEQNNRRLWKHYPAATSLRAVNMADMSMMSIHETLCAVRTGWFDLNFRRNWKIDRTLFSEVFSWEGNNCLFRPTCRSRLYNFSFYWCVHASKLYFGVHASKLYFGIVLKYNCLIRREWIHAVCDKMLQWFAHSTIYVIVTSRFKMTNNYHPQQSAGR